MQVTRKYTDLFAEKLKATGDMQQAITKAVWIAYLDGISDANGAESKSAFIQQLTNGLSSGDEVYLKITVGTEGELNQQAFKIKSLTEPNDWDETRIDVIGANGNEGLHYVK